MKVSEAAVQALTNAKKPLHIDALLTSMQSLGWTCGGKFPKQIVSASLYDFIKRHGEKSEIVMTGTAMFGLRAFNTFVKEMRPLPMATVRSTDPLILTDCHCGTCTHISYSGIQEINRQQGMCNLYKQSGRIAVYAKSEACPHYQGKTDAQKHSDKVHQQNLLSEIFKNKTSKKGR